MNNPKRWLVQVANLIFYVGLQLFILPWLVPFYRGTCFVYIGYLLVLPWEKTHYMGQLVIGFVLGLFMDMFYDSAGKHAFCGLLLVYLKNNFLFILPPIQDKYTSKQLLTVDYMGLSKFLVYVGTLIWVYHTTIWMLYATGQTFFFTNFYYLVASIGMSFGLICLGQLMFIQSNYNKT